MTPFSLANIATLLFAALCFSTVSLQAKGAPVKYWRLAVPASLAGVQSLVLLAGVFEVSWATDLGWVGAACIGGLLGRLRGWSTPIEVDFEAGVVRQHRAFDSAIVAAALVLLAVVDAISATRDDPLVSPGLVAAGAAFCAGFLVCRALATATRAERLRRRGGPTIHPTK